MKYSVKRTSTLSNGEVEEICVSDAHTFDEAFQTIDKICAERSRAHAAPQLAPVTAAAPAPTPVQPPVTPAPATVSAFVPSNTVTTSPPESLA